MGSSERQHGVDCALLVSMYLRVYLSGQLRLCLERALDPPERNTMVRVGYSRCPMKIFYFKYFDIKHYFSFIIVRTGQRK